MSATPTNSTPHDHAPHTAAPPGPGAKPPAADGGRDSHGRFAEGNRGGPGNPFARQVAALRCALLAALTPQDIEAVAQELLRQAKEGSLPAARLLLSYTLGKPAPAVDPDTLDLHEFGLYQRLPDPRPEMMAAGTRVGLPFALKYLRVTLPGFSDAQERMLADGIADQVEQEQRQAAARQKRQERRAAQQAAAAKPAPGAPPNPPPAPPVDEEALARLGRLLGLTVPSTNGLHRRPHGPRPPSTNGRTRPGGPGGPGRS
jgi:hypothetical protein